MTYAAFATAFGCAWITVWRWVGWLATLVTPAAVGAREKARESEPAVLEGRGVAEPRDLT